MGIRTVKPTSPARRYLTYVTYEELTRKEPEKRLLLPKTRTNGRNAYGRITVRHRGGGAKRMLRQVDFRRDKFGIPARVAAIEYDPNRSARLALLHYRDGENRPSARTVRPIALSFYGPIWLLAGWCELREDFRSFRLDRISRLDVLDERFRPERGKTLHDFLKRNDN